MDTFQSSLAHANRSSTLFRTSSPNTFRSQPLSSNWRMHLIPMRTMLSKVDGFVISQRTNSKIVPSRAEETAHFCLHCVEIMKSTSSISISKGPDQTLGAVWMGYKWQLLWLGVGCFFVLFVSFGFLLNWEGSSSCFRIWFSRLLKCCKALLIDVINKFERKY